MGRKRYYEGGIVAFFLLLRWLFSWSFASRVTWQLDWAFLNENLLNLQIGKERPSALVKRIDKWSANVKLRVVGDKHDALLKLAPSISGLLRGRLKNWEARPGVDVNGGNYIEYEIFDSSHSYQLRPTRFQDYKPKNGKLKIADNLQVDVAKSWNYLVVGSTGTGKSVMSLALLASLLQVNGRKEFYSERPRILILDFKHGEFARIAERALPASDWSDGTDETTSPEDVLDIAIAIHKQRQMELSRSTDMSATALKLGHSIGTILILEELGSGLAMYDKKRAMGITKRIKFLAMQGRSSASPAMIVISQAGSVSGTGLDQATLLNLSNKFVMGAATPTERQYVMAGFDLPNKAWKKGSGKGFFYSDELIAPVEFTGSYPDDSLPDEWLINSMVKQIKRNRRLGGTTTPPSDNR